MKRKRMCPPHTSHDFSSRLLWPVYQYHYHIIQTKYTHWTSSETWYHTVQPESSTTNWSKLRPYGMKLRNLWHCRKVGITPTHGIPKHRIVVVNAVECSRQRPVISTRTERWETAGMQAVAAALLPSTTRSECGCNADWSRISITTHLDNGRSPFLAR
jgi:hypothetical protein